PVEKTVIVEAEIVTHQVRSDVDDYRVQILECASGEHGGIQHHKIDPELRKRLSEGVVVALDDADAQPIRYLDIEGLCAHKRAVGRRAKGALRGEDGCRNGVCTV